MHCDPAKQSDGPPLVRPPSSPTARSLFFFSLLFFNNNLLSAHGLVTRVGCLPCLDSLSAPVHATKYRVSTVHTEYTLTSASDAVIPSPWRLSIEPPFSPNISPYCVSYMGFLRPERLPARPKAWAGCILDQSGGLVERLTGQLLAGQLLTGFAVDCACFNEARPAARAACCVPPHHGQDTLITFLSRFFFLFRPFYSVEHCLSLVSLYPNYYYQY